MVPAEGGGGQKGKGSGLQPEAQGLGLSQRRRRDVHNQAGPPLTSPAGLLTNAGQPPGAVSVVAASGLAVGAVACSGHDLKMAVSESHGGQLGQTRCAH